MKLSYLILCAAIAIILAEIHCGAQTTFNTIDLPTQLGDYRRAYASTGMVNVAGRLGQTGGPQRWDFSEAQRSNEFIRRKEIVESNDGGQGGSFPNSTYAERLTTEATGARSWSYYRLIAEQGRGYYGFHDPDGNAAKPTTVFDAPTVDLPDVIRFGQSWTRNVYWQDLFDAGFLVVEVDVAFTAHATVDAWGTIVMPGGGQCQTLRVNEVHHYEFTERTIGLPLPDQYFRYYYWLVPDIGSAVQILSSSQMSTPPADLVSAADVERVFFVRPGSVSDLHISVENGRPRLDWAIESGASGYRIAAKSNLTTPHWTVLDEGPANFWIESADVSSELRFFRVVMKP